MEIVIHRGAHEIGGTCIELRHSDGARLILDAGRPLDAPDDAVDLLPSSLSREGEATVLICHSHRDHWGLISELPAHWPVWAGESSAGLIELTAGLFQGSLGRELHKWKGWQTFEVGPFKIRPFLTDHSAFDAQMLLIEAEGKRILYSGDFRRHGRKSRLVDDMMAHPPGDVDLLLLEGTNLGSDKPAMPETEIEQQFVQLMTETPGRIFASWSAQNIDRTVSIYRAAKRSGRTLVVDLYTADVLETVGAFAPGVPRAGFPNFKVVITHGLSKLYGDRGRQEFVERMVRQGIAAVKMQGSRDVVMLRDKLVKNFSEKGVIPTSEDAFVWSSWRGYFDEDAPAVQWLATAGVTPRFIHTSGHASPADLRAFAAAVKAARIVPVHGAAWDSEAQGFDALTRLPDGQVMTL